MLTSSSGRPVRRAAVEAGRRIVQASAASASQPAHEVVKKSRSTRKKEQDLALDDLMQLISTRKYDTSGRTHRCPECEDIQKSRSHLRSHLFLKHDIYLCKMSYCDETFRDTKKMMKHYTNAHQRGLFVCDFAGCDEEFEFPSKLQEHQISHSEQLHECDQCEAKFKFPRDLRRHKLSHSGETFHCSECDFEANEKRKLVQHVQQKHTNPSIKCVVCPKRFNSYKQCQRHMSKEHPDV